MSDLVNRLANRVRLTVGRAVLAVVNDALKLQSVQVQLLEGEVRDDAEHFQHYGFTSVPFAGAEGIALAVGGSRDHVLMINIDDRRYRLKALQNGEVALYTDEGDKIVMKRGNQIEVTAGVKVTLVTPLVEATGNLQVAGNMTVGGTAAIVGNTSVGGGLGVTGVTSITGNVGVTGAVTATGDVQGGGKSLVNHDHTARGPTAITSPTN